MKESSMVLKEIFHGPTSFLHYWCVWVDLLSKLRSALIKHLLGWTTLTTTWVSYSNYNIYLFYFFLSHTHLVSIFCLNFQNIYIYVGISMLVTYGEQHQRRRESWSSFRNQYTIQFVEQQKFIVRLQFRLLHSNINLVFWWVVFGKLNNVDCSLFGLGRGIKERKMNKNHCGSDPCFPFLL
jgi:hypothetical protein